MKSPRPTPNSVANCFGKTSVKLLSPVSAWILRTSIQSSVSILYSITKTLLKPKFLIIPCMVFITIILPCFYQMRQIDIYSIFERKNGFYTNKALFYQDILRYSRHLTREKSSKDREITRWLLENNQEMRNGYIGPPNNHVPHSTRVENRLERVKGGLQDLIDLGLMQKTGTTPAEKGGTRPVGLYGYTANGRFLACLVENIDPNKREKAYNDAFSILQSILSIEPPKHKPPSHEKFLLTLYKKYKDRGVFGEFFMDRLKDTLEPHSEIKTERGVWETQNTIQVIIGDSNKLNLFVDLWEETLYEMTSDDLFILLDAMSSEISRKQHRVYMSSDPTYGEFNLINFPELRAMDLLFIYKRLLFSDRIWPIWKTLGFKS